MALDDALRLTDSLTAAGLPCVGVAVLDPAAHTVRADYSRSLTPAEQTAAANTVAGFDWSDVGRQAWLNAKDPDRADLLASVASGLATIDAFLAITSPTAAQVRDQVVFLSRALRKFVKWAARDV